MESTNLDEWFIGTVPTDHLSGLFMRISESGPSWDSRINELYQLQGTTDLTNEFSNVGNPVLADSTNTTVSIEYGSQGYFRVQRLK